MSFPALLYEQIGAENVRNKAISDIVVKVIDIDKI